MAAQACLLSWVADMQPTPCTHTPWEGGPQASAPACPATPLAGRPPPPSPTAAPPSRNFYLQKSFTHWRKLVNKLHFRRVRKEIERQLFHAVGATLLQGQRGAACSTAALPFW